MMQTLSYFDKQCDDVIRALEDLHEQKLFLSYEHEKDPRHQTIRVKINFWYRNKEVYTTKIISFCVPTSLRWCTVITNFIQGRKKGVDAEIRLHTLCYLFKKTHRYDVKEVYFASEYVDTQLKGDIIVVLEKTITPYKSHRHKLQRFIVPIQVKSSAYYQLQHIEKNPYTPSLVINDHISDTALEQNFMIVTSAAIRVAPLADVIALLKRDANNRKKLQQVLESYSIDLHK